MLMLVAFTFVVVIVVVVMMLLGQLRQRGGQRGAVFHGRGELRARQLVPGSGDDDGVAVELLKHSRGCGSLVLSHVAGAAENDHVGILHLVVEKFPEVSNIHFALVRVHHSDFCADLSLVRHCGDGAGHV